MKILRALTLVISVVAVSYFFAVREPETHTRMFCAYGRIFVEFQERNNVWGVLFLDDKGFPVRCSEDPEDERPPKTQPIVL